MKISLKYLSWILLAGLLTPGWADIVTAPSHAPAPGGATASKAGEMDVTIKGQSREKLTVGKFDPPAAFNLEDIQNFPEERLHPVLTNPITFEEGKDFSSLMDFKDDQLVHPWLPPIAKAPFLVMQIPSSSEKSSEWTFAIIDQAGATAWKQEGKGNPPSSLSWNGEDSQRGHVAVDTVYIPQLQTVDKGGYHHTLMGQPIQYSSILYKDQGKTIIELSSKKLFAENKSDFTKEAPFFLEKVCDVIREDAHLPFAIQAYDNDAAIAHNRQQALVKYFTQKLILPDKDIVTPDPASAEKRGNAIAIISNVMPGGSGQ